MREANERAVLTALRRLGEASKADLAHIVRLTENATGMIVKDLAARGLIEESRKRFGARGQPATLLRLASTGAYAIGIKIGRRTQQSLLMDFSGKVLTSIDRECIFPMPNDALASIDADIALLRDAVPAQHERRLVGVGLAMPYNLGSWRRELDIPADVCAAWNRFDIGAAVRSRIDCAVFVENDGTAAAAAELFNGAGRTIDDFAVAYVGVAIGGGLVLGGTIHRGLGGNAADIGLMPVAPSRLSTAPIPTGASDILLNRASAGSLMRHLAAHGVRVGLTSEIDQAMTHHPDLVQDWIEDAADALTMPLFTIASLLDIQAIVIDGLLPRPLLVGLVEYLRRLLAERAPEARTPPNLLLGSIGRNAAALGAATLPFYFNYAAGRGVLVTRQRAAPPAQIGVML